MPFLNAAVAAGNAIDVNAVKTLRGMQKVVDACKIVMDAILIILFVNLDPVKINQKKQLKNTWDFMADSYDTFGKDVLKDEGFVKRVQNFTEFEKDKITDEQCELLEPYLNLELEGKVAFFTAQNLSGSNGAMATITTWAKAMYDYHNASKIVKPKLDLLKMKEADLKVALENLMNAEEELDKVQKFKAKLQAEFDEANAKAKQLEEQALITK